MAGKPTMKKLILFLLMFVLFSSVVSAETSLNGSNLVIAYNMVEGVGTRLVNNGSVDILADTNADWIADGNCQLGTNCLFLDGSSHFANTSEMGTLIDYDSDFTIAMWARRNSTTGERMFWNYVSSTLQIKIKTDQKYSFTNIIDGFEYGPGDLGVLMPLNEWVLVSQTWNATSDRSIFYINNTEIHNAADPIVTPISGTDTIINIGRRADGGRLWGGYINGFWIWNSTLDGADINNLWNSNAGAGQLTSSPGGGGDVTAPVVTVTFPEAKRYNLDNATLGPINFTTDEIANISHNYTSVWNLTYFVCASQNLVCKL